MTVPRKVTAAVHDDPLWDLASYGIAMLDAAGVIRRWNRGMVQIFGYAPEQAIGRPVDLLLAEADRSLGEAARLLDIARTDGASESSGWLVDRDGNPRWQHWVIEAMRDPSGELTGFAWITRATGRFATQSDAALAAEFQQQKLLQIAQFARRIIHDYSNVFTVLTSNLERLRKLVAEGPRAQALLDATLRAVQRATTLTHQLHLFTARRAESGEAVDIAAFLQELDGPLRLAAGDLHTLSLEIDLPAGLAHVDPLDLECALLALVANAREAMPDGGVVALRACGREIAVDRIKLGPDLVPGRYIAISVTDKGTGMSPEVEHHAFEPFFTTKGYGVVGLGLAQVYGCAKSCGGAVELRTAPGKGTAVTLLLPFVRP